MASRFAHQPDLFERSGKEEQAIRVQDYLNDKLQESADLAGIDSLLEDVKQQQKLLKQQVLILLPFESLSAECNSSWKTHRKR